jgi:hypothetical protein
MPTLIRAAYGQAPRTADIAKAIGIDRMNPPENILTPTQKRCCQNPGAFAGTRAIASGAFGSRGASYGFWSLLAMLGTVMN